tara:strand:- start:832 stop:1287 length:456 start_codon:yes stop_codon:yes gene_type:complete
MKKLIYIFFFAFISLNAFANASTDLAEAAFRGLIGGGAMFLVLYLFSLIFRGLVNITTSAVKKVKPKIESTAYGAGVETKKILNKFTKSEMDQLSEIDDIFYEKANRELEENQMNEGLWIKVGIMADGQLSKQKSEYIKQRARQLSEENSK